MAKVNHHLRGQTCFNQPFLHVCNVLSTVVRLFTTAQNDMAVTITTGIHNG